MVCSKLRCPVTRKHYEMPSISTIPTETEIATITIMSTLLTATVRLPVEVSILTNSKCQHCPLVKRFLVALIPVPVLKINIPLTTYPLLKRILRVQQWHHRCFTPIPIWNRRIWPFQLVVQILTHITVDKEDIITETEVVTVDLTEEFLPGLDPEDSTEIVAIDPAMLWNPNHLDCTLGLLPEMETAERVKPEGIMQEEDTVAPEARCPVEVLPENMMP